MASDVDRLTAQCRSTYMGECFRFAPDMPLAQVAGLFKTIERKLQLETTPPQLFFEVISNS